jgi:predicted protein tyrosine phosphatase
MTDEPRQEHPPIVARSLPEANQSIIRLSETAAVISIGEPDSEHPYGFEPSRELHFRFEFHDVINEGQTKKHGGVAVTPPSPDDVERMIELAPMLEQHSTFVFVHCNAGISRSTATSFILRCVWLGAGHEEFAMRAVVKDREQALPNKLMVNYADEILERGGAMLEAVRAHYQREGLKF